MGGVEKAGTFHVDGFGLAELFAELPGGSLHPGPFELLFVLGFGEEFKNMAGRGHPLRDIGRDGQRQLGFGDDYAEGVNAFLEKRPARFTDKV